MTRNTQSILEGKAHVWHVSQPDTLSPEDATLLSSDELERAERFRFADDRNRFIHCRAALRRILGSYLDVSPCEIKFSYNEFGKPHLQDAILDHSLKFNVSHTNSVGLIAVSRDSRIGVDVENLSRLPDVDSLAKTILSGSELKSFRKTNAEDRTPLFLKLWTCKEALAKADGRGLSVPPAEFEFEIAESNNCWLRCIAGDAEATAVWSLVQFELTANCVGAVAVESPGVDIEHFHYANLNISK